MSTATRPDWGYLVSFASGLQAATLAGPDLYRNRKPVRSRVTSPRHPKLQRLRANVKSIEFAYTVTDDGPAAWMLCEYPDGETDQPGTHIISEGATRANCLRRFLGLSIPRYPVSRRRVR